MKGRCKKCNHKEHKPWKKEINLKFRILEIRGRGICTHPISLFGNCNCGGDKK